MADNEFAAQLQWKRLDGSASACGERCGKQPRNHKDYCRDLRPSAAPAEAGRPV